MKVYSVNGVINNDLVQSFIGFYNQNFNDKCTVFLNTRGGETIQAEAFLFMLNKMPDVTLFIQNVYSAGFKIAIKAKCKKVLSFVAKGMWHYGRLDLSVNVKNKPYWVEDECMLRNLPIEKRDDLSLARKVMTTKEFKAFKKDQDVYFDFNRMRQIFPDAEIMK